ncbi:MAG: C39 family peptidase [Deltaproteobacteria bacterium]|nr:C39 family peptidase [Deltaproteobacteria bacterium]
MQLSSYLVPAVLLAACDAAQTPPSERTQTLGVAPGKTIQIAAGVDRLESDTHPITRRSVVGINRGYNGGADMAVLEGGRVIRVERASEAQSVSRPVWSLEGACFAYVEHERPRATLSVAGPVLQFRGRVRWQCDSSDKGEVAGIDNASRVLGWASGSELVITRFEPGDLPEERPYVVALRDGTMRPIGQFQEHMYSIAWSGERILFAGTQAPVITAPVPGQTVGIYASSLAGETTRVASLPGQLPRDLRLHGELVHYALEGSHQAGSVSVRTGETRTMDVPAATMPETPSLTLMDLTMPYVHQVYDTPDDFNGHWACGPTSTLMGVCRFGRLDKWPETVSTPTSHVSDYGAYVSRKYTAFGTTFDTGQGDASGKTAWGAYGWCTEGGAAWAWRMQDYAKKHNLNSDFDDTATLSKIKAALDAGKVVALSTQLTSAGHIIAIKGYTADDKMVVNDPYGDANAGYMNYGGEGAKYTFAQVSAKWFITIYATGPQFKATIVDKKAPTTLVSGETATASVTYKNEGWATWDNGTVLGTTEARDRESPFYAPDWKKTNRPTGVDQATATGQQITLSFSLRAPVVCSPKQYTEHFNLVQEGVAWFSDSAQGGPADDALAFAITVNPAQGGCSEAGAPDADKDSGPSDAKGDGSAADSGATGPDGSAVRFGNTASDDGCSCRAVGERQGAGRSALWLVAALAMGARRRRRSCVAGR